jgi:hypothetical protein
LVALGCFFVLGVAHYHKLIHRILNGRKLLLGLVVSMLSASASFASVLINLGGGELFQSNGTSPIPAGSLLQLVASTSDSVFTSPTPTSFTGGSADDIVVASFAAPDNSGSFAQPITLNLSGSLDAGDPLLLRWWPSLTISASTPGTGATFGQFRTDATENFSDSGWFVPADGSNIALNFLDTAGGGTEPNSAGTASFSTTAVPETSTVMCAGLCAALLLIHAIRRHMLRFGLQRTR